MERNTEVEEKPRRKGGLRTMPFIIVNESFERVATTGLNMTIYLIQFYGMSAASASSFLGIWGALSSSLAIVGAFVSDSCLGRFRAVSIGSISILIGMVILWLTTMIPQLRCSQLEQVCNGTTAFQLAVLYSYFVFTSIGSGFVRPCSIVFGVDQLLNKANPKKEKLIDSYFNWYYVSTGISAFLSMTVILYIQEHYGWKIGFGIPVILMFVSVITFQIGSPLYIKVIAKESLFTGLLQAAVAAFRKRHTRSDCDEFYHQPLESDQFLVPSNDFRCLNRACVIQDPTTELYFDGSASDPWSLCGVEQLESLKALLRVLPIWSTGIMVSVVLSQFSFSVLQTRTMDRHLFRNFEVPAASFSVFLIISLTLWIALYDRVLEPLLKKYTGQQRGISPVIRMGFGLVVSCLSLVLSAITESIRRRKAIEEGHEDDPNALVNMSAMWFVPQYALLGIAEAAYSIGQIELFYSMLPKSMSSIASAMYTIVGAVSGLVVSSLISGVDWLSSTRGKTSWLSTNINRGHLDYYFWLLAFLALLNFFYFLLVCRLYHQPATGNELSNEQAEENCEYTLLSSSS